MHLFDPILTLGEGVISTLTAAFAGFAGPFAAILAIVVVTVIVRLFLSPLAWLALKNDVARRRTGPKLAKIFKSSAGDPTKLIDGVRSVVAKDNFNLWLQVIPSLAQAPVVSLIFGLFHSATIAGAPNALLNIGFFGVPLGKTFYSVLFSSLTPYAWVPLLVLLAYGVALFIASRRNAVWSAIFVVPKKVQTPTATAFGMIVPLAVFAIFPMATLVYFATSTLWGVAEASVTRSVWKKRNPNVKPTA